MTSFKSLFGLNINNIKKTCILAPFFTKRMLHYLKISKLTQGMPYSSANGDHFTFICTRIGPAFVGDAVLYLKKSPCKNIILLGTCGLTQKTKTLKIGSTVLPQQCMALESFSQLLEKSQPKEPQISFADKNLLSSFNQLHPEKPLQIVKGASMGSLYLEKEYLSFLLKKQIETVDMECSAFFTAARSTQKKAMALFTVTDILDEKHVYQPITPLDKVKIELSQKSTCKALLEFSEE